MATTSKTTTPNYDIDYNDVKFQQVEADKQTALDQMDKTYDNMIGESDRYYQAQIDASKEWADKQTQLQQEQTDFTIEKIEQEKDKAHKDYLKEQSGAYVDWQKQSNQYGVNAEKEAASGLTNTGYSESSQVSMYNTYQNRVATAREVFTYASLNYDNAIKDARLQNNAALAEIAYTALQQQLELALSGFQYKNNLILEQANKKLEVDKMYYQRYLDVLNQMNTENALAEETRQFNEKIRQFNAELERLKAKDDADANIGKEKILLQRKQLRQEQEQWEAEMQLKREELNRKYGTGKITKITGGGGSGGSGSGSKGSGSGATAVIKEDGAAGYAVNTPYYQGSKNPDASKYGTFSNGYQPKGISGHGKLKNSGQTVQLSTQMKYGSNAGKNLTLTQTVWEAEDGTRWYWEGRQNKYIRIGAVGGKGGKF